MTQDSKNVGRPRTADPRGGAGHGMAEEVDRWDRETRAPEVDAQGEREEAFTTQAMKWPIKPLYSPADLDEIGFDYLVDSGFPGE